MKNETFTVVVFASDDFKHFNKQSHWFSNELRTSIILL